MRTLMAAIGLLALASPAAAAPPIRNGGNLGVGLGGTTQVVGLDYKYWVNPNVSTQGIVGVQNIAAGFDPLVLGVQMDVLGEIPIAAAEDAFDFGINAGVGGLFGTTVDGDFSMVAGANLVVGLEGNIDALPLDVVIDYRPTIFFLDDLDPDGLPDSYRLNWVEFGAHVRYWF